MTLTLTQETKDQIAFRMCSIYGDYETTAEALLMQYISHKNIQTPIRGYCYICEKDLTDECTKH
jgi:hypothetical protein